MNASRKYYLQQYANEKYQHGGQGYVDMERILEQEGYWPYRLEEREERSRILTFFKRVLQLVKVICTAKKSHEWVFIYPVYGRMNRWLLRILCFRVERMICIVGDIDGFRDGDNRQLVRDLKFLRKQKMLIIHNLAMKDWLEKAGCRARMATLSFFDFLCQPSAIYRKRTNEIVFAGNLSKAGFLLDPALENFEGIKFLVYGKGLNIDSTIELNFDYRGGLGPHELVEKISGSFGLIWDGDRISKISGPMGEYLQINSQHKLSTYILAGLPILIPRMAGAAPLVEHYGIGIVFNNTADIPGEIKKLSEESYQAMRRNMVKLAGELSRGQRLRQALAFLHQQES